MTNWHEQWIGFALGIVGGLIATLLYEPMRDGLGSFFQTFRATFDREADSLAGQWRATFEEKTKYGEIRPVVEVITIKHWRGSAHATATSSLPPASDDRPRKFKYTIRIHKNTVYGSFRNTESQPGAVSGRGVFFLEMSADRRILDGQQMWFDTDEKKVVTSAFVWKRP